MSYFQSESRDLNKIKKNILFLEKLKDERRIQNYILKKDRIDVKQTACRRPFEFAAVHSSGSVYTCCPVFVKNYSIGNINENTLEEIWNSEKADELRKKILNNDYSMCSLDICSMRSDIDISVIPGKCRIKRLSLSYDRECNLCCITCRDEKYKNTNETKRYYDEFIYSKIKSILSGIEIIDISGSGEAFYSKHSRELIKKTAGEYPHIKWNICSNGLLFNTSNCKELGIYGKINEVLISLPAIDKDIYNKIMRGSDYDTVMKNIKSAVYECRCNKSIKTVRINSVISSLNYKEIPKTAEFSRKNNIFLTISQFCYWGGAKFGRDYKSVSVWDKEHPEYENFKKILKHPSLNYNKIIMTPLFAQIRNEA